MKNQKLLYLKWIGVLKNFMIANLVRIRLVSLFFLFQKDCKIACTKVGLFYDEVQSSLSPFTDVKRSLFKESSSSLCKESSFNVPSISRIKIEDCHDVLYNNSINNNSINHNSVNNRLINDDLINDDLINDHLIDNDVTSSDACNNIIFDYGISDDVNFNGGISDDLTCNGESCNDGVADDVFRNKNIEKLTRIYV